MDSAGISPQASMGADRLGATAAATGLERQEGAGGGDGGRAWQGDPMPTERSEDRADEDEEEDTDASLLQAGVKRRRRVNPMQRRQRRTFLTNSSRSAPQVPGAEV